MNDQAQLTSAPDTKLCSKCREFKPFGDFRRDVGKKYGLESRCKICRSQGNIHVPPVDLLSKSCKKCGQDKPIDAFDKKKASKDGLQTHCKACRATSPCAQSAATREYARKYRAEHPLAWHKTKQAYVVAAQKRRARLAGVGGRGVTAADMQAMIYCQQGLCAYCERDGQKLTLDHIIPIFQGGPHDPDNCCMCCGVCNSSKNNRTPDEWEKAGRWFDIR